jgi:iron complex outermembrane recepter protein
MFKRTSIGMAVLMAVSTGSALAQAAPVPATPAERLERVEVTGSRILSFNAESAAPVQVLTSADIAASGVVNLQELLLKNPVFGTPGISRTNSNFSTSSAGVATVNLRNLGANRTLVLVNGRRFVSGVPGTATVDLNSIPTDFIERVEILTGGASSSYGSDAVGGVVNLILKKSIRGLSLDAQIGQSWKNDDKLKKFSATYGLGSESGADFLAVNLSVSQQGAVMSKDRDASAVDQLVSGDPTDAFKATRPAYSSFAPQGRFFYTGAATPGGAVAARNFTYDASGNVIPFSINGPAGDGVGATGFNRSALRTIAIPTDRLLLSVNGEKAIGAAHSLFLESTFASTRTHTRLEPLPIDSTGGANPIYTGGRFVPAEFLVNGVMTKNPLVPDYLFSRATDRDADGARDYNFTRRLSDIDLRTSKADRNTFRVLSGVRGELTSTWSYDAYASYAFTKDDQNGTGQVNVANFRNALEAIPDVNDVNGNGSRTDAICRDAVARAQGCVPVNVFGAGTISPAAAAYIGAPGTLTTKLTQRFAGANVSGDLMELPAGPIGLALGVEYRKETSIDQADALTERGLNAGNARPKTEGVFDVKEIFGELRIPLLKDLPLVKRLDTLLAVRSGDYSTVGSVTSWNAAFDWALNPSLRMRVTRSTSTRAPDIGELYQGRSQTFPTGLVDPCVGVTATSTTAASVRCRADAGVRTNIAANGSFTLTQADVQGISGYNSGNPKLGAETGKSLTVGFVFTPKGIDLLSGTTFTVDYYDIVVANGINTPGRQYSLDQCYRGDASFCKDIARRPTAIGAGSAGAIATIDQSQANTGGLAQRGVDLTASYASRLGAGALSARLAYTYLIRGYTLATPEAELDYFHNEVGSSRNRWVLNLGYDIGKFGIKTTTTFIGQAYLDDKYLSNAEIPRDAGLVKSKAYFDTQLSYQWQKKQQFYAGVNNLMNVKAPPIVNGLPSSVTGTETDAGTYDAIGRRYYVGWRMSL